MNKYFLTFDTKGTHLYVARLVTDIAEVRAVLPMKLGIKWELRELAARGPNQLVNQMWRTHSKCLTKKKIFSMVKNVGKQSSR